MSNEWWVKETRDKQVIQRFLETDRLFAAYALGDLEPTLFEHCRWFLAGQENETLSLGLLFTGLTPWAFLSYGQPDGIASILAQDARPERAYFILPPDHTTAILSRYKPSSVHHMRRMAIAPQALIAPPPGAAKPIRLRAEHLSALQSLYAHGDVYGFSGYQLGQGVFYGILDGEQLLASAGTHLVAENYGVAAVGNVFTHPDHRRRGYGSACTYAVTQALLSRGLDVVLNVAADNQPAIHIYEQLGFRVHRPFIEMLATDCGS